MTDTLAGIRFMVATAPDQVLRRVADSLDIEVRELARAELTDRGRGGWFGNGWCRYGHDVLLQARCRYGHTPQVLP